MSARAISQRLLYLHPRRSICPEHSRGLWTEQPRSWPISSFAARQSARYQYQTISSDPSLRYWGAKNEEQSELWRDSHLVLDRIFNDQLHHLDRSMLSQSVDPVHGLIFHRRVPPGVHHEYHGRFREVLQPTLSASFPQSFILLSEPSPRSEGAAKTHERNSTSFEGDEENSNIGVFHYSQISTIAAGWRDVDTLKC